MAWVTFGPMRVRADEAPARGAPTKEISGGVDARSGGWAAYAGYTMAVGTDLYQDGWRLRASSGYGNYWFGKEVGASFRGSVTFGEVLAGYQFSSGPLTVKAFAGLAGFMDGGSGRDQRDDLRVWQSSDWTFKGAVETWLNIGTQGFGQLDVVYETEEQAYGSRLRLGYRLTPQLSIGPEGGLSGASDYESGRAGAFVRYEWPSGEVSVSVGATGDRSTLNDVYGTANVLYRF